MKAKTIDWFLWKGDNSISGSFKFPVDFVLKADKEYVFFLNEYEKTSPNEPDYRLSLVASQPKGK